MHLVNCCLLLLLAPCCSFYLPGVAPIEYEAGAAVELKVNKLTSVKTQLPYSFYTLDFCQPDKIQMSAENLGEILTGDTIQNSAYNIRMLENQTCRVLCKKAMTGNTREKFRSMIDDEYLSNWIIDNLPAATRYVGRQGVFDYGEGFPVGFELRGRYYINNHVKIDIQYHAQPDEFSGYRVVGFEVEPRSIEHDGEKCVSRGGRADIDKHEALTYSYDVEWTHSPLRWVSRWDSFLKMKKGRIHWFSILNSLVVVTVLSCLVILILIRTLARDIARYNELTDDDENETGWKLCHGDVFRKPKYSRFLAVSVGSGCQVLCMCVVILFFGLLGFMSPAHRGGLLQSMMMLFTLMGIVSGFVSSRLYKLWGGEDWKMMTVLTALFYPGIIFFIFFILNLFIWGQKSSGAVPFTTMFAILVLWFGISVPLVYFGAYMGFREESISLPNRVNQIPRTVPDQPWFASTLNICVVGGLLPFGSAFTEISFILSSMWQHQYYYLFGILSLVLLLTVAACAQVSIAVTYYTLVNENHKWWWRSFSVSGSAALYMFLYSMNYLVRSLHMTRTVSILLYVGYMAMASMLFGLFCGSVGFLSSLMFCRAIYSSIKID